MSDIIIFSASDGSVIIRHPALGHDASMLAGETPAGMMAIMADHTDLPTAPSVFRSAWRMGADGHITVDIGAARVLRTAALATDLNTLIARIDAMALGHIVDGDMAALANARSVKAALVSDTGSSLDGITDLDTLASAVYPSMTAATALLTN